MESSAGACDLFEDVAGSCGPDEGFGLVVVPIDVVADGHNELFEVPEDAAPDALLSQVAEEAFAHVQPRGGSGREVHTEAAVPLCRSSQRWTRGCLWVE